MKQTDNQLCMKNAQKSLPNAWYYDIKHHKKEMGTIWANQWIYACPETSLSNVYDYKTITIDTYNIILVREKEGDIKAYHNACRHRGSQILGEEKGKLQSNILVCPYHQWCYSASDGSLKSITSQPPPEKFDATKHGLIQVNTHIWRGLVFINMNMDSQWNTDNVYQHYEKVLDNYPIEHLTSGHIWRKAIQCNWKVYWENFSECLHCPNLHPELSNLVPIYAKKLMSIKEVSPELAEKKRLKTGLKEGAETWSMDGSAQGHAIESYKEHVRAIGQSYSTTWPSMYLGAYGDHMRIVRLLPIDHQTTELVAEWFFPAEALQDPSYKKENVTDFAILVMEQDSLACELNQKGLNSAQFSEGVLMPEEHTIKDFHDWLKSNME